MPTYDFTCPECGREQERVLRLSESNTPQQCSRDECSAWLVKEASAPALKFKGAGWTPRHYPGKK